MYLPPLDAHPGAEIVALCGRREQAARDRAEQWGVPHFFTDPAAMLDSVELDAVVIATSNDSHHSLALAAIERRLHVLCEKPLALNASEADDIADRAAAAGVITMVPLTYHYMPVNQWLHRLVQEGYVGRVHHVNLRYYTEFGFDPAYSWRFDVELAGSGIVGDLGPHWLHLAEFLVGENIAGVSALTRTFQARGPRPDGTPYEQAEDSAVMTVDFPSGAYGIVQVCCMSWEGTPFGQTHELEIHGDQGTLYATCDWDTVQEVRGIKRGDTGGAQPLPIPDEIWQGVRRGTVHETYKEVFRRTDAGLYLGHRARRAHCARLRDRRPPPTRTRRHHRQRRSVRGTGGDHPMSSLPVRSPWRR